MSGISADPKSSGGKLNVELSLVPFIDLLSTLVLFLLLSAVWTQMGALPSVLGGNGVSQTTEVDQTRLMVAIVEKKINFTWPSKLAGERLPASAENLDKVFSILEKLAKDKKLIAASVSGVDKVPYGYVIQVLDKLKTAGLVNVSLSTN